MQLLLHYTKLNYGEPKNEAFQDFSSEFDLFWGCFWVAVISSSQKSRYKKLLKSKIKIRGQKIIIK